MAVRKGGRALKKRDRQMALWMEQKREELKDITDGKERLAYFQKTVLPEMSELEQKEQRTWDENRADFSLHVLDRGFDRKDKITAIPRFLGDDCDYRDLDELVFSKDPADIHHLVTDRTLCYLLKQCTDRQKELLFYIDVHRVDGTEIAEAEGIPPRNVTSVHARTLDDIRTHILPVILLKFKLERDPKWQSIASERFIYTIYEERFFCATQGKNHLKYWEHSYFEGINFDLKPITEHFNAETKRKRIAIRKQKPKSDDENNG